MLKIWINSFKKNLFVEDKTSKNEDAINNQKKISSDIYKDPRLNLKFKVPLSLFERLQNQKKRCIKMKVHE